MHKENLDNSNKPYSQSFINDFVKACASQYPGIVYLTTDEMFTSYSQNKKPFNHEMKAFICTDISANLKVANSDKIKPSEKIQQIIRVCLELLLKFTEKKLPELVVFVIQISEGYYRAIALKNTKNPAIYYLHSAKDTSFDKNFITLGFMTTFKHNFPSVNISYVPLNEGLNEVQPADSGMIVCTFLNTLLQYPELSKEDLLPRLNLCSANQLSTRKYHVDFITKYALKLTDQVNEFSQASVNTNVPQQSIQSPPTLQQPLIINQINPYVDILKLVPSWYTNQSNLNPNTTTIQKQPISHTPIPVVGALPQQQIPITGSLYQNLNQNHTSLQTAYVNPSLTQEVPQTTKVNIKRPRELVKELSQIIPLEKIEEENSVSVEKEKRSDGHYVCGSCRLILNDRICTNKKCNGRNRDVMWKCSPCNREIKVAGIPQHEQSLRHADAAKRQKLFSNPSTAEQEQKKESSLPVVQLAIENTSPPILMNVEQNNVNSQAIAIEKKLPQSEFQNGSLNLNAYVTLHRLTHKTMLVERACLHYYIFITDLKRLMRHHKSANLNKLISTKPFLTERIQDLSLLIRKFLNLTSYQSQLPNLSLEKFTNLDLFLQMLYTKTSDIYTKVEALWNKGKYIDYFIDGACKHASLQEQVEVIVVSLFFLMFHYKSFYKNLYPFDDLSLLTNNVTFLGLPRAYFENYPFLNYLIQHRAVNKSSMQTSADSQPSLTDVTLTSQTVTTDQKPSPELVTAISKTMSIPQQHQFEAESKDLAVVDSDMSEVLAIAQLLPSPEIASVAQQPPLEVVNTTMTDAQQPSSEVADTVMTKTSFLDEKPSSKALNTETTNDSSLVLDPKFETTDKSKLSTVLIDRVEDSKNQNSLKRKHQARTWFADETFRNQRRKTTTSTITHAQDNHENENAKTTEVTQKSKISIYDNIKRNPRIHKSPNISSDSSNDCHTYTAMTKKLGTTIHHDRVSASKVESNKSESSLDPTITKVCEELNKNINKPIAEVSSESAVVQSDEKIITEEKQPIQKDSSFQENSLNSEINYAQTKLTGSESITLTPSMDEDANKSYENKNTNLEKQVGLDETGTSNHSSLQTSSTKNNNPFATFLFNRDKTTQDKKKNNSSQEKSVSITNGEIAPTNFFKTEVKSTNNGNTSEQEQKSTNNNEKLESKSVDPNAEFLYTEQKIQLLLGRLTKNTGKNIEILAAQSPHLHVDCRNAFLNLLRTAIIDAKKKNMVTLIPYNTAGASTKLDDYGLSQDAGDHWIGVCIKQEETNVIIKFIDPLGSVHELKNVDVEGRSYMLPGGKLEQDYEIKNLFELENSKNKKKSSKTKEQTPRIKQMSSRSKESLRNKKASAEPEMSLSIHAELFTELLKDQLIQDVNIECGELKLVITGIVQQTNSIDCGPYIVHDLTAEALDKGLTKVSSEVLRQQHKELLESKLTLVNMPTLEMRV